MQRINISNISLHSFRIFTSITPGFCTEASSPPDLRKLLRKFYLKVHPDLFSSYPKEQTVNQNSLKELTSFTEEWCKNTSQSTIVPKTKKEIQFYLKKRKNKDEETLLKETNENDDNNDTFTLHKMTLVSNGAFNEVQAQYAKLFEQAGLPSKFIVDGKSSELSDFHFMDEFLAKHKEEAREKVKKEDQAAINVTEIIFRLKHHYKITINTDAVFENYFHYQNFEALDNLYKSLESLKKSNPNIIKSLEGAKVGFDSPSADYSVDYEHGHLFVDREGSAIEFVRNFQKLDLNLLKAGIENRGKTESEADKDFKKVQGIVDNFTKQIGVSCIELAEERSFYTEDYQMDEDGQEKLPYNLEREFSLYKRFARSLQENRKVLSRSWPKGKMKHVKVYIRSLLDDKEYFITATPSLLISPLVSPSRFLELIHEHGNTVVNRLKERDLLRNKMHYIMTRMGLDSININFIIQSDPDGHRKAVSAINRLEKVAGELRKFDLSGLIIGIDNQYNVEADGSLWIKWNFQTETLKKLMGKIKERQDEEKIAKQKQ